MLKRFLGEIKRNWVKLGGAPTRGGTRVVLPCLNCTRQWAAILKRVTSWFKSASNMKKLQNFLKVVCFFLKRTCLKNYDAIITRQCIVKSNVKFTETTLVFISARYMHRIRQPRISAVAERATNCWCPRINAAAELATTVLTRVSAPGRVSWNFSKVGRGRLRGWVR